MITWTKKTTSQLSQPGNFVYVGCTGWPANQILNIFFENLNFYALFLIQTKKIYEQAKLRKLRVEKKILVIVCKLICFFEELLQVFQ